jgi:hypothetical protein
MAQRARAQSIPAEGVPWLWSIVVALMMSLEAAYLEHCRNYTLTSALDLCVAGRNPRRLPALSLGLSIPIGFAFYLRMRL